MPKKLKIQQEFKASLAGLTVDDLHDLLVEIGRVHNLNCVAVSASKSKMDTVRAEMFDRKTGGHIGISDHAVLRYMERHKGFDVRAIRLEISALAKAGKAIPDTDGYVDIGGGLIAVAPQQSVVATVLFQDEKRYPAGA